MYDDNIKAIRDWLISAERPFSYFHTKEEDDEDVIFVNSADLEDFIDFLRDNEPDLICIRGNIGTDGVWFSTDDLERARYY